MINYPRLIGISGPAGSGKNFLANCITAVLPNNEFEATYHLAFAHPLKDEVREALINGVPPPELVEDPLLAEIQAAYPAAFSQKMPLVKAHEETIKKDPWMRDLLQWWGTDYRRKKNPDYWVEQLAIKFRDILLNTNRTDIAIITDVRFPNEAQYCLENGMLLLIDNPEVPFVRAHESESHFETIRKMGSGRPNFAVIHNHKSMYRPEHLVAQFFTALAQFNMAVERSKWS